LRKRCFRVNAWMVAQNFVIKVILNANIILELSNPNIRNDFFSRSLFDPVYADTRVKHGWHPNVVPSPCSTEIVPSWKPVEEVVKRAQHCVVSFWNFKPATPKPRKDQHG
jgi:hypothetical protein